jgi:hypothetical protein
MMTTGTTEQHCGFEAKELEPPLGSPVEKPRSALEGHGPRNGHDVLY